MNKLETALQYAEDVRDGKILTSKYIRLAVERHYRDLENAEVKGWYFSDKAAEKALMFFDFLVLSKGVTKANVPKDQINRDGTIRFQLAAWQAFMVVSIFGWKKTVNDKRRFTEAYIEIPKKNGKSTLASGIANYMLIADKEAGPEVYFGAYTRDQAGICFEEATAQIKDSYHLKSRVTILKNTVTNAKTRAKMMAVSHDADNTEGKNGHCVVIDEYHVHKSDKVKDSLGTGQSAREQPLMFVITTAGYNKQGPCFKHRDVCIGMLEGKYNLDNVFVLIYGVDEGDDWKDEVNWVKANPTIGVTTKIEKLREEFAMAQRSGTKEVDFKTKRLNLWVDAAITWIPSETWKRLAQQDPKWKPPKKAICYGGLDLATTSDICSFSLYFPEYKYFTTTHYVPEEAARYAARSGIDYLDWINGGHLIQTPGKTTDYDYIKMDIMESAAYWDLKFCGYDRWNSSQLVQELNDELGSTYIVGSMKVKAGYEPKMQKFGQGFASMSTPTKEFEKMCVDEIILHDNNPVTAWMLGNVAIDTDPAGNIKTDKAESKDKIDGVVAMIIATGVSLAWHNSSTPNNVVPAC